MRIVFMGTPDFSVPALRALVEAGHQVTAVVTQPDKPKGRGKDVQMTPVKIQALEYGIPVYQPVKVKTPEFVEVLKKEAPDAIVVIAFGQILSKEILDLPKYGCVNIHASLLPKYRGAAPIQWAVIDGEKETGVTTMMHYVKRLFLPGVFLPLQSWEFLFPAQSTVNLWDIKQIMTEEEEPPVPVLILLSL